MLFDSTVRKELARSFGLAFVVILTIVVTMLLVRSLGMAAKGSVAPQHVLLSLGYLTLSQLPVMLSLSLFVSVVMSLGRMYKESEMTVWFSSGLGLSRFVRPVLTMASPVMLVVTVLMTLVLPWSNSSSAALREQFEQRSDLSRVAPGQFQTSSDGSRVFFIERDPADETAARNVFIMSNSQHLESVTTSARGTLVNKDNQRLLVLEHGQRNDVDTRNGDKAIARFERYTVVVDDEVMRSPNARAPKTRTTADLMLDRSNIGDGELAYRFGMVLGCLNLVLLGIGISATNPRRASNWNLMFALLAFIVYFNLINLSQSWVTNGKMKLGSGLLALHGAAFIVTVLLLIWRDMGNRLSLRRPSKSAPPPPSTPSGPSGPSGPGEPDDPSSPPSTIIAPASGMGGPMSIHHPTPGVPA
ncbi:LPS export ABC transporter permease LptF [Roseateles amylovorans]|jgi:lipopolysaccharide export system permease protein|uniref:Lipopolysaccharide export system permease protein LptF n=1 Tax=Roseateles amylovorans TaxID=2978473 RepID=A0ABY6AV07_9BURK|nr:LPS export ABC transporter permease LptF [Roseateles amylovorans]UXH76410.1 LPS export ABC transporter permease LptF [Roseateles amylovorans]